MRAVWGAHLVARVLAGRRTRRKLMGHGAWLRRVSSCCCDAYSCASAAMHPRMHSACPRMRSHARACAHGLRTLVALRFVCACAWPKCICYVCSTHTHKHAQARMHTRHARTHVHGFAPSRASTQERTSGRAQTHRNTRTLATHARVLHARARASFRGALHLAGRHARTRTVHAHTHANNHPPIHTHTHTHARTHAHTHTHVRTHRRT